MGLLGAHCRPKNLSIVPFRKVKKPGSSEELFMHADRYVMSPVQGPSDWGRLEKDRLVLASAIGEMHRAYNWNAELPQKVVSTLAGERAFGPETMFDKGWFVSSGLKKELADTLESAA